MDSHIASRSRNLTSISMVKVLFVSPDPIPREAFDQRRCQTEEGVFPDPI